MTHVFKLHRSVGATRVKTMWLAGSEILAFNDTSGGHLGLCIITAWLLNTHTVPSQSFIQSSGNLTSSSNNLLKMFAKYALWHKYQERVNMHLLKRRFKITTKLKLKTSAWCAFLENTVQLCRGAQCMHVTYISPCDRVLSTRQRLSAGVWRRARCTELRSLAQCIPLLQGFGGGGNRFRLHCQRGKSWRGERAERLEDN